MMLKQAFRDARAAWADRAAQPYVYPAVYANQVTADEVPERVRSSYGPARFARLVQLKAKHDPKNLFRNNHNIPPAP
jgi:hypothetical protein